MGCCSSASHSHGPPTHPFDSQDDDIRYNSSFFTTNSQTQHRTGSQVWNIPALSELDYPPPYSLITPDGHKSIAKQHQPTLGEQTQTAPLRGWGETPRCLTPLPPNQLLVQPQLDSQNIQAQMQLLQQVISLFQPEQQSIATNSTTNAINANNYSHEMTNEQNLINDSLDFDSNSSFSNMYSESINVSASLDAENMFTASTPNQFNYFPHRSTPRRKMQPLNHSYPLPLSSSLIQWPSPTYCYDDHTIQSGFLSPTVNQSLFNRLPPILDGNENSNALLENVSQAIQSSPRRRGSGKPRRKKRRKRSSVGPTPSLNTSLTFSPEIRFTSPTLEATAISAQHSITTTTSTSTNTTSTNSTTDAVTKHTAGDSNSTSE